MFSIAPQTISRQRSSRLPEFSGGWYGPRVEVLKENLDIEKYFAQVAHWVLLRPPMQVHDADHDIMWGKNVPGEIEEARIEHAKEGQPNFDPKALVTEWGDVGFFPGAHVQAARLPVDLSEVRRNLNGHGKRTGIYDHLREIAGNMTKKSVTRDTEEFLRVWMVGLAGLPTKYPAEFVHQSIFEKNSDNYPAEFFSGKDPVTGEMLNPEELDKQFMQARKCLKFIRNYLRDTLKLKDRDYGLKVADYENYRRYILDFRNSDWAFSQLQSKYPRDPYVLILAANQVKMPHPQIAFMWN